MLYIKKKQGPTTKGKKNTARVASAVTHADKVNDEFSSQPEVNLGPPDSDKDAPLNPEVNPGPPERDKPAYFLSEENFPPLGKSGLRSNHNFFPQTQPYLWKNPSSLVKSGDVVTKTSFLKLK